jgi:MFS family permease
VSELKQAVTAADIGLSEAELAQRKAEIGGRYSWYVLGILVVVYMFNFIDRQILAILADDIKADLGLTDAHLGFLYGTAFAVFYSLFGIPLGRLADMWLRGRLMAMGLTLWSAMTALSGFASSFAALAVARVGVGIGEASASPAAFSMLSDLFPKEKRATVLAIYTSGLYLGGGISVLIGGLIVDNWNAAFPPGTAPLGLKGWQAAFLAVGLPGIALAVLVATLREPVRGLADGILSRPEPHPWRKFFDELSAVLPPLTLLHLARHGATGRVFSANLMVAGSIIVVAYGLTALTGDWLQWSALALGLYAATTWAQGLALRDKPTYALIFGSPVFVCAVLGFGLISFSGYAVGFWAVPYVIREFGVSKTEAGIVLGLSGMVGSSLGVISGGRLSDWLRKRRPDGRILLAAGAVVLPIPFMAIAFTTGNLMTFYAANLMVAILGAIWVGAAGATSQDLVLPHMRGASTATYFLGTTLIGLALGPYYVGKISTVTNDLGTAILWLWAAAPLALGLLWYVARNIKVTEETRVARAEAA